MVETLFDLGVVRSRLRDSPTPCSEHTWLECLTKATRLLALVAVPLAFLVLVWERQT